MNTGVSVRSATTADIAAIRTLMQGLDGVWQKVWRVDVLERALDSARGLAFVAEHGSTLIGFVCAHDVGFRGYLSELAVEQSWHRRGIGTLLVHTVVAELARNGCALVIADVYPPASGFYERSGWFPPDALLLARRTDGSAG